MKINHYLFAALFAALGLAVAGSGSAAPPDGKTAAGGKAPLGERLAREFPVLESSLAARSASFKRTTRTLSGNEVTGLAVSRVQMNPPGVSLEGGGMRAGLKPEEEAALRSLAEREGKGGEFKVFFPAHYTESIAVEGGGISAVLRPLGARPAPAQAENGQVVYYEAYRATDSLHVIGEGRSEEFLYLRSEAAPRRFEYELSEIKGAREVTIEAGAIRFAGEPGRGLQIEAPWVVDASGKRREGAVKWELGPARGDGSRRLSLVLVEGAKLSYPAVIDPSWSTPGALATGRYLHTATLLPNGKVLVVGGDNGSGSLSSAELYDPALGTWSGTGGLATARIDHTATLLPNGKVLVAGGVNTSTGYLSSTELYDSAAGTWSGTGGLATARRYHTATLLPNGKVLVAGGFGASGALTTAELYDPALGTWSGTGGLATARRSHTATLLANGKVLVAGGINSGVLSGAELYDPALGTWSGTGSLAAARYLHTATLLPNGKVLVAGGTNTIVLLSSAELYDPAAGTWSGTGGLAAARRVHTATLLPNGKVLVAGGIGNGTILSSAELYDPAAGIWSGTTGLAAARRLHPATLLADGKVLMAGGFGSSAILTSAELYDSAEGTWSGTGPLATARSSHTVTLLPNGKVLAAGGQDGVGGYLSSAELYDPALGTWSGTGGLATARYFHTATLLPNGKVLVTGGFGNSGFLSSAELYDPALGTWSGTGGLATARAKPTATLLPNGKVLVAGGYGTGFAALSSAELYDPVAGTWSGTGGLATARVYDTAALLPNGKVLVAGGQDGGGGSFSSAELYDPAAGTWSGTGGLATARDSHTATLLPNGKVLVAAGQNNSGGYLSSAELYDPALGTWSGTGGLTTTRAYHTVTLLPNGNVLVAGGDNGAALSSAELYDPAAGTWSGTGGLATAHRFHPATLLPNGKVLVAGGFGNSTALISAELYDVGLGYAASSQPVIATASSPLEPGAKLVLTGTRFRGVSGSSSDNTQSSSTNYPVVQLRRLDSEQVLYLPVDPASGWSDTSFTSIPISGFPGGLALATVFTNGIPSDAAIIVVKHPPVAVSQSIGTNEDVAVAITLTGTDADGDPLTFSIVAQPMHGVLSGTAPNRTYTPAANYNGPDSFTFKANDGSVDSNVATVSINVAAVNDAPVANGQSVTTNEDTAKAITLTGSDIDGTTPTFSVVAQPMHGVLSGTAPNLTYTPAANYNGPDSFTFKANDGSADSNVATVTITVNAVNDAPVANAQAVTTNEDTAKAITLTGSDVEGSALTFSTVTQPANGALTGTAPNWTYAPKANFHGSDTFTFKANDGAVDSNTATISITVTAVNDAPSFVKGPNQNVSRGSGPQTIPNWATSISAGPANESGQSLSFLVSNDNNSLFASQPAVGSNGTLSYTPASNAAGTATVTVVLTDNGGTANSGTDSSAPQTFTITVTASSIQALNLSSRLRVGTGDKVMIGGFIITGTIPKRVVLRGRGPSLVGSGIPAASVLNDPVLELHGASSATVLTNDDWKESPHRSEIEGTAFEPTDDRESVIVTTLPPAAYTVILKGAGETSGVGLVEVYDNDPGADSDLANISTRGFVQTGEEVLIGGFILDGNGNDSARMVVRGIGPSLSHSGLTGVLADPTLELHDANGTITISNDNWMDDSAISAELMSNGLAPSDALESAIIASLPPGQFTAILAGKNGGIGIGLVEIYNLQ